MIPMMATFRWRQGRDRNRSFWIPLFLVWLILLPVTLVILPFFAAACLVGGIDPFRAIGTFAEIFGSLKGTRIEIDDPHEGFEIILR